MLQSSGPLPQKHTDTSGRVCGRTGLWRPLPFMNKPRGNETVIRAVAYIKHFYSERKKPFSTLCCSEISPELSFQWVFSLVHLRPLYKHTFTLKELYILINVRALDQTVSNIQWHRGDQSFTQVSENSKTNAEEQWTYALFFSNMARKDSEVISPKH